MRRVTFDYPNTCPKVDKAISQAEDVILNFIDSLLDDACPLLTSRHRSEIAQNYTKDLYAELEPIFEGVREANADMRSEAESQIADLMNEVDKLEAEMERSA